MSARRTSSPIVGPGRARVRVPSDDQTDRIHLPVRCGMPSNAAPAPPRAAGLQTPKPCSSISTRSPTRVAPGAHAILLLDQAGWHGAAALKVRSNISLCRCRRRSPELSPEENIWQFMRQNWLSNHIFKDYDDIVDHCRYAWNILVDQPWKSCPSPRRSGARRSLIVRVGIN